MNYFFTHSKSYLINAGLVCLIAGYSIQAYGQCMTAGPNGGAGFSTNTSIGTLSLNNPTNAASSNNSYVTATAIAALTASTNYLVVKDFGFSIPATATICGIEARVEKSATGINLLAFIKDNSVRLIKGGGFVGSNYATTSKWTSADVIETYGSPADLWGSTWTPEEICDANFGIAFSGKITGIISLFPTLQIDNVTITVYYSNPLPVIWLYFKGVPCGDKIKLNWSTASETNADKFVIQQSADNHNWKNCVEVAASGNTTAIHAYETLLNNTGIENNYYRIKEVDYNGNASYSSVIKIDNNFISETFELGKEENGIYLTYFSQKCKAWLFRLTNSCGIKTTEFRLIAFKGWNKQTLPIKAMPSGLYLASLTDGQTTLTKKFFFDDGK